VHWLGAAAKKGAIAQTGRWLVQVVLHKLTSAAPSGTGSGCAKHKLVRP